ncbi:transporter substrate-binding domain-containing protein [Roseateles sp. DAIF2]|uniref:substrate-binding periplasmic protein n=1 Tax=Roseateles sp. DAIF2 TaxID=2714952 RepID=UPI0018A337E3|nr:transporter substrate-binding domain-containing protein [Roseateles sp. DAIF2]QPF71799.1 transporter substrate-binding domain-containing protein [Roseateles sp. DAIF2]
MRKSTGLPRRCAAWVAVLSLLQPAAADPPRHFVTEPFPPYTYAGAGGSPAGPMVEVLREACAALQWQCEIELLPWRRALAQAQRGEVDGIFTVVDTPERRAYFHVSVPVIDARYTLFARAGDDFLYRGERQQLLGRTIAAYGPSATVLALDELAEGLELKTEVEPDNPTVLRKLAAGRYGPQGLALINESVALHLIREQGIGGLQAAGMVRSFAYAFGLSRQRIGPKEFQAFNAALVRLCRSGRSAELIKPHALPASACGKA